MTRAVLSRGPGRGRAAALLLTLLLAPVGASAQQDIPDPLEPMNRAIFRFNDAADRHVLEPVARTYQRVTPEQVRRSVRNFLANLSSAGKKKVTFKAAAAGTHFFFEEPAGVTVYVFDGDGYRFESFIKSATLASAMKRYGAKP